MFDINGRQVESLVNGSKLPGAYQIQWHADQFASGMYFAKLISGGIVKTQKIILLKKVPFLHCCKLGTTITFGIK